MKAFLLDDHSVTREGMKSILADTPTIHIVGECEYGKDALQEVARTRPDVVIVGLNPTTPHDGGELCRGLKGLPGSPRVLVFSACERPEQAAACLVAGADGFLHKTMTPQEVHEALTETAFGRRPWLVEGNTEERKSEVENRAREYSLTPQESEVLGLLLYRYSNAEIAEALKLGEQTVKNHVSGVLKKLGLGNRREVFSHLPPPGA